MQRQMFEKVEQPNEFKGFSKLPEEVQMKMNPELAKKYKEGGPVFDLNSCFFRDNPEEKIIINFLQI